MQPGPCFQLLILRVGIINEAHRRATAVDVHMYLCTSTINWGLMRALAQMVASKCILKLVDGAHLHLILAKGGTGLAKRIADA